MNLGPLQAKMRSSSHGVQTMRRRPWSLQQLPKLRQKWDIAITCAIRGHWQEIAIANLQAWSRGVRIKGEFDCIKKGNSGWMHTRCPYKVQQETHPTPSVVNPYKARKIPRATNLGSSKSKVITPDRPSKAHKTNMSNSPETCKGNWTNDGKEVHQEKEKVRSIRDDSMDWLGGDLN